MEKRDKTIELVELIDKHMQKTAAVIDYQYELDALKEKWRNYEQ